MLGVNDVKRRVERNSSAFFHTPAARPASPAAPSAVVSTMSGRSIGNTEHVGSESASANRSRLRRLSTRSRVEGRSACDILHQVQHQRCQTLSPRERHCRTRWVRPVFCGMPLSIVPRASASHVGSAEPKCRERSQTPPVDSMDAFRARRSRSPVSDDCQPVARHCTAAPAMKTAASSSGRVASASRYRNAIVAQ